MVELLRTPPKPRPKPDHRGKGFLRVHARAYYLHSLIPAAAAPYSPNR
jgi:hypothetical protein